MILEKMDDLRFFHATNGYGHPLFWYRQQNQCPRLFTNDPRPDDLGIQHEQFQELKLYGGQR